LRPPKLAATGVVSGVSEGSQRADWLLVVTCTGPKDTALVLVTSVSASRMLCRPSGSAPVSNDSVPEATFLHETG
jgi:hypothetical protein